MCTLVINPRSALRSPMHGCLPVVFYRRMLMRGRGVRLVPATPLGCIELLTRSGVDIQVSACQPFQCKAGCSRTCAKYLGMPGDGLQEGEAGRRRLGNESWRAWITAGCS